MFIPPEGSEGNSLGRPVAAAPGRTAYTPLSKHYTGEPGGESLVLLALPQARSGLSATAAEST
jgi:hypothetical protein